MLDSEPGAVEELARAMNPKQVEIVAGRTARLLLEEPGKIGRREAGKSRERGDGDRFIQVLAHVNNRFANFLGRTPVGDQAFLMFFYQHGQQVREGMRRPQQIRQAIAALEGAQNLVEKSNQFRVIANVQHFKVISAVKSFEVIREQRARGAGLMDRPGIRSACPAGAGGGRRQEQEVALTSRAEAAGDIAPTRTAHAIDERRLARNRPGATQRLGNSLRKTGGGSHQAAQQRILARSRDGVFRYYWVGTL